jgi:hypothetical protein
MHLQPITDYVTANFNGTGQRRRKKTGKDRAKQKPGTAS